MILNIVGTLYLLAVLTTAVWWITRISLVYPTAYPRAAFAVCVVAGTVRPNGNPLLAFAAGIIVTEALQRAWNHYQHGLDPLHHRPGRRRLDDR